MSRSRISGRIGRRAFLKAAAGGATGLAIGGAFPAPALAQGAKRPVTIWTHFAGSNYEIFSRYVAQFNQAAGDVEIKTTSYGPAEITPKYLASVAAGAPPDIFHSPGFVPPDMAH